MIVKAGGSDATDMTARPPVLCRGTRQNLRVRLATQCSRVGNVIERLVGATVVGAGGQIGFAIVAGDAITVAEA